MSAMIPPFPFTPLLNPINVWVNNKNGPRDGYQPWNSEYQEQEAFSYHQLIFTFTHFDS